MIKGVRKEAECSDACLGVPAHTQVSDVLKSHDSFQGVSFASGSNWPGDVCVFLFSLLLSNQGRVEKLGVLDHPPLGTLASYSSEGKSFDSIYPPGTCLC